MKTITANNWTVLNNLIYKIYTTEDSDLMQQRFLEQLKLIIDFDCAEFYLTDLEDANRFVKRVSDGCEVTGNKLFVDLLKQGSFVFNGKTIVFRMTDILRGDDLFTYPCFCEHMKPQNLAYAIFLVVGDGQDCMGLITLYRAVGKEDFDADDVYVLDLMKDHLVYRLSVERAERDAIQEKLTVTEATEQFGLTKRESGILRRLMQGQNNNQISEELNISVNTLKKHVLNIYRKLNINNRVQLFKSIKEKE